VVAVHGVVPPAAQGEGIPLVLIVPVEAEALLDEVHLHCRRAHQGDVPAAQEGHNSGGESDLHRAELCTHPLRLRHHLQYATGAKPLHQMPHHVDDVLGHRHVVVVGPAADEVGALPEQFARVRIHSSQAAVGGAAVHPDHHPTASCRGR